MNMKLYFSFNIAILNIVILSSLRKRKLIGFLAFLDICIKNKDLSCLLVLVYLNMILIELLIKFFSFTSFSYHIGLIRIRLDRACKINNTLLAFNEDVKKFSYTLKRNQFPEHLINIIIDTRLDKVNDSATHFNDSTPTNGNCTLHI